MTALASSAPCPEGPASSALCPEGPASSPPPPKLPLLAGSQSSSELLSLSLPSWEWSSPCCTGAGSAACSPVNVAAVARSTATQPHYVQGGTGPAAARSLAWCKTTNARRRHLVSLMCERSLQITRQHLVKSSLLQPDNSRVQGQQDSTGSLGQLGLWCHARLNPAHWVLRRLLLGSSAAERSALALARLLATARAVGAGWSAGASACRAPKAGAGCPGR